MKRNVTLLALAQAVMMSGGVLLFATGSLVGSELAENKGWATIPVAFQMAASLAITIPASLLMARIGRRAGFMLGAALALGGALLAAYGIAHESFFLFCIAAVFMGAFAGIGNYFRFAAVDVSTPEYRARAVSYVLAGGIAAALVGPNLATWGAPLLPGKTFGGGYLAAAGLYLACFLLLAGLRIPKPGFVDRRAGRPLARIARQPAVIVAVIAGALGYGIMALIMTATPLAMHGHHHHFNDTAFVIEWHVLGMFLPSFFTGRLIQRFGVWKVMMTGAWLNVACVTINLLGSSVMHFWAALLLLGIGWNFLFIGATQLLTTAYEPVEQAKVQGANDFVVFGISTLCVLSAGALQHHLGWRFVNIGVVPGIALVIAALFWLRQKERAPTAGMERA